ncbi:rubrerythrin family protein [Methanocella sp. CWC-04]|uniref:Rubrerythrin family protein n=1 Tax=Methanooceanicella nereidis TaxID=2052831 RepID=A0AAP2RCF5_9EURY|nr:ferritin family protein [Methanocella sp. CWC-04]MCD1294306.1 rubrerythrin family protein [Methanocella sp. CWC-04]
MNKTLENVTKAFVGESQARNRYTFYASTARKEGYEQISEVFTITADNENEHAEWFFKFLKQLNGGEKIDPMIVEAVAPTTWGTTIDNLKAAIAGENEEHTKLYPEFASIAEQEGFKDIANRIRSIAIAETHHEERFAKVLKELEAGTFFKKSEPVWWFCRKCGYKHYDTEPPAKCPSCDHERSYYQKMCEQF